MSGAEPFPEDVRRTLRMLARELLVATPEAGSARQQNLLGVAVLLLGTHCGAAEAVRTAVASAHEGGTAEHALVAELRRRAYGNEY